MPSAVAILVVQRTSGTAHLGPAIACRVRYLTDDASDVAHHGGALVGQLASQVFGRVPLDTAADPTT